MKLIAICTISNGIKTYNAGDIFEIDKDFTESLVPGSAKYAEPSTDNIGVEDDANIDGEIENMTMKQLQTLCKKYRIEGAKSKTREQLIELIELAQFDNQEG